MSLTQNWPLVSFVCHTVCLELFETCTSREHFYKKTKILKKCYQEQNSWSCFSFIVNLNLRNSICENVFIFLLGREDVKYVVLNVTRYFWCRDCMRCRKRVWERVYIELPPLKWSLMLRSFASFWLLFSVVLIKRSE